MKTYCIQCGHPNEYSGEKPDKCGKCKSDLGEVLKKVVKASHIKPSVINEAILVTEQDDLSDSDFGSFMESEPEPVSQEEIFNAFLSEGTNKGFKLRDLIPKEQAKAKRAPRKKK